MAIKCISGSHKPALHTRPKEQLLNHVVDDIARENPELLYAELPVSPTSFDAGFRHVTYRDFANAINGMAWWLTCTLGPGGNFETLAYLGPNDLRHNILVLGAVKAGYKMLFTAPRYSVLGHVHLMKQLDCKVMLAPRARPQVTDAILEVYEMHVYQIPTLKELFDKNHTHYPYNKTYQQARSEPLVVLHTSGTTSLPRPIIWTHDWVSSWVQQRALAPPPGFDSFDGLFRGTRLLSMFTPYHAGHLNASLLMPLLCGTTIIYPLSGVLPSAQAAVECSEYTNIQLVLLLPPHVEEIGRNPEMIKSLSNNVESLFWAGGDISTAVGEAISSKINLFTGFASTEMGLWNSIRLSEGWKSEDWHFMRFHPDNKIEFRHHVDDLYEAFTRRIPNSEEEQPIFKVFPKLQEYSPGDYFSPHPSDSQLWRYRGRTDDMQVFISGEKYHPVGVEARIRQHPDVQDALLVGTGRSQAALMLEMNASTPATTTKEQEQIIARLWPTILDANQLCPAHAKITAEHIMFVDPQKPMERTAKGSVSRARTVNLYEAELDALYAKAAAISAPEPPTAHSLLRPNGH